MNSKGTSPVLNLKLVDANALTREAERHLKRLDRGEGNVQN